MQAMHKYHTTPSRKRYVCINIHLLMYVNRHNRGAEINVIFSSNESNSRLYIKSTRYKHNCLQKRDRLLPCKGLPSWLFRPVPVRYKK